MVEKNDTLQLKFVFDSIDKNRDGELSLNELEQFAQELGWVCICIEYSSVELQCFTLCRNTHSEELASAVNKLLQDMDSGVYANLDVSPSSSLPPYHDAPPSSPCPYLDAPPLILPHR